MVPRVDAGQCRRAEGKARIGTRLKGDFVVQLWLVVGQRQESSVVVAADGLGFGAIVRRGWRW